MWQQCEVPLKKEPNGPEAVFELPEEAITPQFRKVQRRLGLHLNAGGFSMRPWRLHAGAGFVSMWAQAFTSSFIELPGCDRQVCAFPELEDCIEAAGRVQDNSACDVVSGQARDLVAAWAECCDNVVKAYPDAVARQDPTHPGRWYSPQCTGGDEIHCTDTGQTPKAY